MAKLVVTEFLTLDGVMQAPGDPNEDRSGGFASGGWQPPYFDEVFGNAMLGAFADTGGFLLGRRTYEFFAAHWPHQRAEENPLAGTFNELPKYVVSRSLSEPLVWRNSHLIRGDVESRITDLKKQDGKDVQVIGSGELVQTLLRQGLADEYRLMIHPVVLGSGKRLFRDGTPVTRFRLVDSTASTTGVLMLTYVIAPGEGSPADHGSAHED